MNENRPALVGIFCGADGCAVGARNHLADPKSRDGLIKDGSGNVDKPMGLHLVTLRD